jgi:hypothetical protein
MKSSLERDNNSKMAMEFSRGWRYNWIEEKIVFFGRLNSGLKSFLKKILRRT